MSDKLTATSSGNGYCRFPDGTQICWITKTVATYDMTTTWGVWYRGPQVDMGDWPMPFVATPAVSYGTSSPNGGLAVSANGSSVNATSAGAICGIRPSSITLSASFHAIGIGRWK